MYSPLLLLLLLAAVISAAPLIKVNRLGYVQGAQKLAVVTSSSSSALAWQLKNSAGQVVASGNSQPYQGGGVDPGSGERVHRIDFSSFDVSGSRYTLCVQSLSACSLQFDIGRGAAEQLARLRYDSAAFFYHQRSGIAIEASLTDNWHARAAGHLSISPNQGDTSQSCRSSNDCSYRLDVRGGWYDAGDQGKYLVNGGISLWLMLNTYERTLYAAGTNASAWADGQMRIPERGNGVPDLLDEARWELEFFLRMQVPDNNRYAGMCHHKIGDALWTAFPMKPSADSQPRVLAPVSTAATLNMAAVTAMAARIYSPYDSVFATRCLNAAKKAYAAAKQNPSLLAATSDEGSGTYEDSAVGDEFYWAAVELFITTGSAQYFNDARAAQVTTASGGTGPAYPGNSFWRVMDWPWTAPLADLSLITVPNNAPAADLASIKDKLVNNVRAALQLDPTGYPAFTTTEKVNADKVYWGSNGLLGCFALYSALAYEITGQAQFANAVYTNLGYLHGVNPLGQVYVAGYGGYSSDSVTHNVHHRFWCNQVDSSYPTAPAGAIAGGPNCQIQDPQAQADLKGCVQQKCYEDHTQSYSTNEVCINWQAELIWMVNWAADHAYSFVPAPQVASSTAPAPLPPVTSTAPAPVPTPSTAAPAPLPSTAPRPPPICPFMVTDVGSNGYWLAYNLVAAGQVKSVVARQQLSGGASTPMSGPNSWGGARPAVYTANVAAFSLPFYLQIADSDTHAYTIAITSFKEGASFTCLP